MNFTTIKLYCLYRMSGVHIICENDLCLCFMLFIHPLDVVILRRNKLTTTTTTTIIVIIIIIIIIIIIMVIETAATWH